MFQNPLKTVRNGNTFQIVRPVCRGYYIPVAPVKQAKVRVQKGQRDLERQDRLSLAG